MPPDPSRDARIREAAKAVAAALEVPHESTSLPAMDRIQQLATQYRCEPAADDLDQCAKVLRAALAVTPPGQA